MKKPRYIDFPNNTHMMVYDNHPIVEKKEDGLYILDKKINIPETMIDDIGNYVPGWLVAREWNGLFFVFVCGVDLTQYGYIWTSIDRKEHVDAETAFDLIRTSLRHGNDFEIFIEEPLIKE